MNETLETYKRLFDIFLRICKKDDGLNSLSSKIAFCDKMKYELLGMVHLLERSGIMSQPDAEAERERIIKTFDSMSLYNAIITEGNIINI